LNSADFVIPNYETKLSLTELIYMYKNIGNNVKHNSEVAYMFLFLISPFPALIPPY